MDEFVNDWDIPPENIKKYEAIFNNLEHVGDKVTGKVVFPVLMGTKLPTETLRQIWDLSDIDKDGCLDRYEFILTMHLVCRHLEGESPYTILPTFLIPPNKRGKLSAPLALMPPPNKSELHTIVPYSPTGLTAPSSLGSNSLGSIMSNFPGGPPAPMPEWSIPLVEQTKFASIFANLDQDVDGLVTGTEVRDFFILSGLPQLVLAKIWDLVDTQGTGTLNQEQFAVAMYLANDQLACNCSTELPLTLPPNLTPPSSRPATLDPSVYAESNRLIAEIEKIRSERTEVEKESMKYASEAQLRASEVSSLQSATETLVNTSRSLVAQQSEAGKCLTEYSVRRDRLQLNIAEIVSKVTHERTQVEDLRLQVANQQNSIKTQEESVISLREKINERIREETLLVQKVAENEHRLLAVEAENKLMASRIDQAAIRISALESTREQLLVVLEKYAKLLSGNTTVQEPSEQDLKDLFSDNGSLTSFNSSDTGLGYSADFQGSGTNISRGEGAISVPLNSNLDNLSSKFDGGKRDISGAKSSMAFSSDPFGLGAMDVFGTPFGQTKSDPFCPDPFAPNTLHQFSSMSLKDQKCDPFNEGSKSVFNSASFDATFSNLGTKQNSGAFEIDPFDASQIPQKDVSQKVPPPRPTTQPIPTNKKPIQDPFAPSYNSSVGGSSKGFANFSDAFTSVHKQSPSENVQGKSNHFRVGLSTKKIADTLTNKKKNKSKSPVIISEQDQLNWATEQSQRSAIVEATLRKQEEAELQLALRLSCIESVKQHQNNN